MRIKRLVLHSVFYMAGAATSIVAAHQLAPARQAILPGLSNTAAGGQNFLGQIVNRSAKSDRLPKQHQMLRPKDKIHIKAPLIATIRVV
jgi:hypothetical protein